MENGGGFHAGFCRHDGRVELFIRGAEKTKECVIAIPTVDLLDTVVGIGICSSIDTDKFAKFKMTPVKAKKVAAPLIAGFQANIECKVIDIVKKHDIILLEGVAAYVDSARKEKRTIHAVATGIHRATLSKISNQKGYNTTTDVINKLCAYLDVGVGDLAEHIKDES